MASQATSYEHVTFNPEIKQSKYNILIKQARKPEKPYEQNTVQLKHRTSKNTNKQIPSV